MKIKPLKLTLILISASIIFYHGFHLFYLWPDIPSQIAIHFSNGEADNCGSKYFLFVMPIISILIWLLVQLLVRKPEKLNYINLTEKNKKIQFLKVKKVLLVIQYLGSITFIFLNEAFLRSSVGMETSLLFSVGIVLLSICLIAPLYLLIWASTLKY
ncbi:DUF1648 domain-containing protein [Virgibacillus flavescens]|uniref:DUF1648 domain-containing protein n=1 Tax=Virgibacillus flavescens TaxID=1611422 RepID=UPI003D354E08